MFVVAAHAQQPGPAPPVVAGRPAWFDATTEPVGIQHAARSSHVEGAPRRARCGTNLTGWVIFARRAFEAGGAASCRRCTRLLSNAGASRPPGPSQVLTDRESEVLRELALGGTYADAARALFVTENTVKTHVSSLYRKLGVERRAEALRRARETGLI